MRSVRHPLVSVIVGVAFGAAALTTFAAVPAAAGTVCDPAGDSCVVTPDTVQTPVGLITVTGEAGNVVVVQLDPSSPRTLVIGIPFTLPALPAALPGYNRTRLTTAEGVVTIDSLQLPGFAARFAPTNLAAVSLLPPGPPCRARTTGTTVTFTPVAPLIPAG